LWPKGRGGSTPSFRTKFSQGEFPLSERSESKGSSPILPTGRCTYLLICEDGSYYTGSTDNLAQRIRHHASGKGSGYTKSTNPKILAWHESHPDQRSAGARERQIKGWSRAKKNQLARGAPSSLAFGSRPWSHLR
jgi:putative endonuclease